MIGCGEKSTNKLTTASQKENLDSLLKLEPNNANYLVTRLVTRCEYSRLTI